MTEIDILWPLIDKSQLRNDSEEASTLHFLGQLRFEQVRVAEKRR
tara:strand:- start:228 stop:362 length:135 start_codon:yes stop_codon:yes gene_type:complete